MRADRRGARREALRPAPVTPEVPAMDQAAERARRRRALRGQPDAARTVLGGDELTDDESRERDRERARSHEEAPRHGVPPTVLAGPLVPPVLSSMMRRQSEKPPSLLPAPDRAVSSFSR